MSLSLSVAVALIAIVAKDWCYQFTAGRTGRLLLQGRRRQLRWEGIEKWKMQEILNVLPLMMHAALLLFAVGLSLYLWDINPRVALPVVVTTILVGLFYLVTLFLPLFFRYCPFTTGLIKLILPYCYKVAGPIYKQALGWLLLPFLVALALVNHCIKHRPGQPHNSRSEPHPTKLSLHRWLTEIPFRSIWNHSQSLLHHQIESISASFMTDRSQLDGQETPMDEVTSSMLGWIIAQCEDSSSVDIALHALLCAKPWLPRGPLVICGAFEATVARLSTQLAAWRYSNDIGHHDERDLRRNLVLHSQCLSLMSHLPSIELTQSYLDVVFGLHEVLNRCWDGDKNYHLASKELGNISLHLVNEWNLYDSQRTQVNRQWDSLKMIVSNEITDLPPADISHLIDGIAKSYLYVSSQSPVPLLDLLNMHILENRIDHQVYRMAGIALITSCMVNQEYPGSNSILGKELRLKRARETYLALTTTPAVRGRIHDHEQLMLFGLVGVLLTESASKWKLDLKLIVDIMLAIDAYNVDIDRDECVHLGLPQDPLITAINWLLETAHTAAHNTPLLSIPQLFENGGGVVIGMVGLPTIIGTSISGLPRVRLHDHTYLEHAKQIIRLARCTRDQVPVGTYPPVYPHIHVSVLRKVLQTNLYQQLYEAISFDTGDIIPHCMSFLWAFTRSLLHKQHGDHQSTIFDVVTILAPLSPQGGLPVDVGGMEFAESWLEKLEAACEHNPQNVLDSQVLEEMIEYYKWRPQLRPSIIRASVSESNKAWVDILGDLLQSCKDRIATSQAELGQIISENPDNQGPEGPGPSDRPRDSTILNRLQSSLEVPGRTPIPSHSWAWHNPMTANDPNFDRMGDMMTTS